MQLIEWTQPNLFTINKPKHVGPFLSLMPGMNEVEEKVWAEAEKHPLVQIHIDEDTLVVHDGAAKSSKSKQGLSGYDVKEAKRIVKKTFDTELLAKWKNEEKRATVVTEIDKMIEKVNSMAKTEEEKAETDNAE